MSITLGPGISPETGEHGVLLQLLNTSGRACNLQGYLTVSFRLSGANSEHPIPPAGGTYVTTTSPSRVILRPRGEAYVLIATYRCDLGAPATVASLAASVPHSTTLATVTLPRTGVGSLPYCPGQPGHTGAAFEMSPIEATIAATAHA